MNSTTASPEIAKKSDANFSLFNKLESYEHEQVVICSEPAAGLKAIIAIHDTTLGPALGGVRMWPYNSEEEAMHDVLRLSRAMTYKAAISGLNFGGGKAVIIGDPHSDKSEKLFRAFGRYVDSLGGRYLTAEDVGMEMQDMEWIHMETKFVTGIPRELGGSGDPSPVTARGVYMGMKACANKAYGHDSLEGLTIGIQGAGHVASYLAELVHKEGAELLISDIYQEKAKKLAEKVDAKVVGPDAIYEQDLDIFSPCALGAVINDQTIVELNCDIVAGGANNVLEDEDKHGQLLVDKGVIYAPDYVINAGGIINISSELEGYNEERALGKASRIYDVMLDILDYAEKQDLPPFKAANILAEQRIKEIGNLQSIRATNSHLSGRLGEIYFNDRN
ncbi:leucine dehydrogenase [Aliifodinibius sp. S!AR15-10]|uniref:Glu/Leu/Phe/Val dehydrogenase dimerization domain-containing protein n=1 Tax=Aliifodinibius sp. S!AR15-10 TaxID=2950437 RepID=UPI002866E715|nr:Glu/Leu/Phe/Val dehydrogenase dimerization domain-containing protein [Aliifodinibius sp. S!AR15-10]MDR8394378.1 leucine dehydrogenase [Aliifodinibius sp. S!AR15-10]